MAGAAGAAWEDFLRRHPETATVDALLPDLVGIPRGKRLTADAFAAALEHGFNIAASVYGLESIGANVAASGLIWESGDADRACFPDPATLRPVPSRRRGSDCSRSAWPSARGQSCCCSTRWPPACPSGSWGP